MPREQVVHVPGLPHTETTRDWSWCAYTQKIRRFCDMLTSVGRRVVLYAGTRNEADVYEHVTIVNDHDRKTWFAGRDWTREVFDGWDVTSVWWQEMNAAAVRQIRYRAEPGDILGIIAGTCQKPVADALPHLTPLEWGIGYEGVFAPYRVYESNAWMHWLWGRDRIADGRFFDAVIPNAYDPDEFIFREQKSDYLLFLGRHTPRKGTAVVEEIAKHHRVLTAGQGEPIPGTEYLGVVGPKERAELLADARALLAPTLYIEPFGGVVVEAAMSGTPAITSPWGCFTETVEQGVTGFRCSTLRQFLEAVDAVDTLHPGIVRDCAERFTVTAVARQYDAYLDQLATLSGKGWYA